EAVRAGHDMHAAVIHRFHHSLKGDERIAIALVERVDDGKSAAVEKLATHQRWHPISDLGDPRIHLAWPSDQHSFEGDDRRIDYGAAIVQQLDEPLHAIGFE